MCLCGFHVDALSHQWEVDDGFEDFPASGLFGGPAVDGELRGVAGGFGQGVGFDGGLVVDDDIAVAGVDQHVDEALQQLALFIAPGHRHFAGDGTAGEFAFDPIVEAVAGGDDSLRLDRVLLLPVGEQALGHLLLAAFRVDGKECMEGIAEQVVFILLAT